MMNVTPIDKPRPSPFGWLSWNDLTSGPLPSARWACRRLELGPGRPCGLWGYAGSGKTWVAQELGVCVAAGLKAFGSIEVEQGIVKHISHELGRRVLSERYRRLGNGKAIDPTELNGNLIVAPYPRIYLNSRNAEDVYARELEGVTLCVIDSLRRAAPGEDENASTISNFLDLLAHVSDKTGCTILLLHHEGKSVVNPKGPAGSDKRATGRGSSAIEDASGCILRVEGGGKGPRKIVQSRAHDDGEGEVGELWIDMLQVAVPEPYYQTDKPALRLVELDAADREERVRAAKRAANAAEYDRRLTEIVAAVESGATSSRALRRACGDSRWLRAAVEELVEAEVLERTGPARGGKSSSLRLGPVALEKYLHPPKQAEPDEWADDFGGGE